MDRIIKNFLPMSEKARELAKGITEMGFDAGICEKINIGIKDRLSKISVR